MSNDKHYGMIPLEKEMRKNKLLLLTLVPFILAGILIYLLQNDSVAVLSPKGTIASEQKDLIVFATLLSFVVIVPVFALTIYIAWKYREGNTNAEYRPDWSHDKKAEALWWGIPMAIILVLAVVTWKTSHSLDPYRPIQADAKPITVQVVALQWRWLFIYPDQQIATINHLTIPEDTPINFEITADAPMNSFWIPELGGQVYAMAGMETKLHLMAYHPGEFKGVSANLSGEGFSDMQFTVKSTSPEEFNSWVESTTTSSPQLNSEEYSKISKPIRDKSRYSYVLSDVGLHDKIIMKYMHPAIGESSEQGSHTEHTGAEHAH